MRRRKEAFDSAEKRKKRRYSPYDWSCTTWPEITSFPAKIQIAFAYLEKTSNYPSGCGHIQL